MTKVIRVHQARAANRVDGITTMMMRMNLGVETSLGRDQAANPEREVGKVARAPVVNPVNPAASPARDRRENQASLVARARQERAANQS